MARGVLCSLIVLVLIYTILQGVWSGWANWHPGSMSRHRDAQAVAITAVAYGTWDGYASYRKVIRTLLEQGLSVQKEDLAPIGATHYFDVMTNPKQLDTALTIASQLPTPADEGLYFSQDEKGMAAFYILSYAIFGISPTSWYWFYVSLYSLSLLTACLTFRRNGALLFFFFVVACAHALVAQMLPEISRQDINVIHGNRFLGIMASVPLFHLMFLAIQRAQWTAWGIAAAALQTSIICLVINARTSAAWIVIAMGVFWASLWVTWLVRRSRIASGNTIPTLWPIAILVLGLSALLVHQKIGPHPAFTDGRAYGGHVFWHNLVSALHNNPLRTERHGIPAEFPVYDDQVGYTLFNKEIARRGQDRSQYLVGNSDWVYRTSSPDLDFRWAPYDLVLRDVFLWTIKSDPVYAINSFLVRQPQSVFEIVLGPDFAQSPALRNAPLLLAFIVGLFVAAACIRITSVNYIRMIASSLFGVCIPALIAAVAELRVVEIFYVLLIGVMFLMAIGIQVIVQNIFPDLLK